MSFFSWQPTYDLGVKEMNDEHVHLIHLMNEVFEANDKKAPKAEIEAKIKALGEFTVKHFTDEEAYMEKVGYPGLETHKYTHKDLLDKFTRYATEYSQGPALVLTPDFFNFLKVWLSAHIQHIDMKYSHHVHGKKAA